MTITITIPSLRLTPAKYVLLGLGLVVVVLLSIAFYTGQPMFFLKWFFGLQADD